MSIVTLHMEQGPSKGTSTKHSIWILDNGYQCTMVQYKTLAMQNLRRHVNQASVQKYKYTTFLNHFGAVWFMNKFTMGNGEDKSLASQNQGHQSGGQDFGLLAKKMN